MLRILCLTGAAVALIGTVSSVAPSYGAPPQAAPSSDGASVGEFNNVRLRAAVLDAQKRLGDMEPFQKRMFEDEVLPQAALFVKHAETTSTGLSVGVDVEAIRGYLSFYAPRALGEDPKKPHQAVVLLATDDSCDKCKDAFPALRKMALSRIEHRGMKPVVIEGEGLPAALREPTAFAKELAPFAADSARSKGAPASLTIVWKPVLADGVEAAHADEKHYRVALSLDVAPLGSASGQAEIMDEDSFETAVERLLTEAWIRLGTGGPRASGPAPVIEGQTEVLIELKGMRDFAHYQKLRETLQALVSDRLGEPAVLEDRVVSRGLLVVAVRTSRKPEEVRAKLADLKLSDAGIETGVPEL